jgi:two-component system, OmpR family, sensor histidine kinase KdpD
MIAGGTLDADLDGMSGIITSRLRADSMARPNVRLAESDRRNHLRAIVRTPDESPKTAVMACLTARSSGNGELLRKASAAAREHGAEFYAVIVDSPHTRFGKAQVRELIDDVILASYFGAKIVRLESSDVVGALLQLARQSNVGRIFIARNRPAPFSRLFGRSVYSDLLVRGEGFSIDVVGFKRGD